MTTPRREGGGWLATTGRGFNHGETPFDAFPFIGDGPNYEFQIAEGHTPISVADALNYFADIGATVLGHERRSFMPEGFPVKTYYHWYLVKWQPPAKEAE